MSKHKNRTGVVYSTKPDFQYTEENINEPETLPPALQKLFVKLDSKMRAGKTVTLISGFIGKTQELELLGKMLKQKAGTGGSVKDGEIIIQGNQKEKVINILRQEGYVIKNAG